VYQHILLPIEPENERSWQKALPAAVDLAKRCDATLHVLTVVPTFGTGMVASFFPKDFEEKAIAHTTDELHRLVGQHVSADVRHQIIVTHGKVWWEICETAKKIKADIIVMSSHKPDLSDVLLTPNAAQVLHHTPISVMIVR
jgi:nucleotide-binding universal stress UspA family protein